MLLKKIITKINKFRNSKYKIVLIDKRYYLYRRIKFWRYYFIDDVFWITIFTLGLINIFIIVNNLFTEGFTNTFLWELIGEYTSIDDAITAKIKDEEKFDKQTFYL